MGETTTEVPGALWPFVTEFSFTWQGAPTRITRRDNHGHLIENKLWAVERNREWYLKRGRWEYKDGTLFQTPEAAWEALTSAPLARPNAETPVPVGPE